MKTKKDNRARLVMIAWILLILSGLAITLTNVTDALAAPPLQITETPTATPEPVIAYYPELSTGNQIEVVRSITYGDIYIIGAVAFVGLILLLYALFRLITHYLH